MANGTGATEALPSPPRITPAQTVRDVVSRYPATGPIFLQHGPMFTVESRDLYPQYADLTLEKYAALNRIALDPLLRLLNAAAEDPEQPPAEASHYGRGTPSSSIGYTGTYHEPDPNVEFAPFVEIQSARGPD